MSSSSLLSRIPVDSLEYFFICAGKNFWNCAAGSKKNKSCSDHRDNCPQRLSRLARLTRPDVLKNDTTVAFLAFEKDHSCDSS